MIHVGPVRFLPLSLVLLAICGAGCAQRTAAAPTAPQPAPASPPVATPPEAPSAPAEPPQAAPDPAKTWVTQPVKADANPQAACVAAALKSGTNPERLSMMIQPKPFSAAAYAKDATGYLNVVEPGRCFQTAQPGPDVPQLVPVGATAANIRANESVNLSVRTKPGFPASFTSSDLGSFQNSLNAITVVADDGGVATAVFTATPGVSHIVHIMAGSPVASGQVNFQVDVQVQGLRPVNGSSQQP